MSKNSFDENGNNYKNMIVGTIVGIAIVVFFIADVIAMIKFSKTNPVLCVACLGLLIFVFGIIALTQIKITWDSWPVIIFPVVGLLLTALPIADLIYKNNTGETIFTQHNVIAMAASGFIIAGVLMIIMPILKRHFTLKKCTETVMAKCVYLDTSVYHGKHGARRVYAPKWEYSIGGEVYEHQETAYTNTHVPSIGEEQEIFVNPYDPNQIYRNNPSDLRFMLFMGISFAVAGILMAYAEFFTQW